MKHSVFLLAVGLLCWTSAHAATLTYSYDSNKDEAENGTALQAAVNAAEPGDVLNVEAGTYYGKFQMKEGVQVVGGWNSSFTSKTDYATILDAQAKGRVLEQPSNFTILTVWSNFTIQNGKLTAASSIPAANLGAGVALGKKGQVKHCLIQNNTFSYNGNCMGGGVGNDAVDAATDVCVDDCLIRNNCGTHGGGVRIRGTVQNSIIENNNTLDVKAGPAGGVHLQGGRMVNCIVRGNLSGGDTGGVRLYGKCQLINCLIVGNTATGKVGGVGVESANSDIIGCTIVNNDQLINDASHNSKCGISCGATSDNGTKLANNIVWGNKHNGVAQTAQIYYISHYAAANRVYNAIAHQNTTNGIKLSMNNDEDDTYTDGDNNEQKGRAPHFADPANGDYRLTESSPVLDLGNNSYTTVEKDLAGNDRIVNAAVDMGAYEYPVVASDVYVLVGEDLQAKINNTAKGHTVYVQAGTYYGNFQMKEGVNVSGGWDANFETKTDYATILDAQESGRVLNQPANFTTLTIWEDLTIQNGKLTAQQTDQGGSGVWLRKNGQVKHCIIQDNTFTYSGTCMGGGVGNNEVNEHSDVLVDNCIIRRNNATHGGGVRIVGTIQNSVIEENSTTNNAAGGVHLFNGGCMYNCIIRNNTAGTTANASTGGVRMSGTAAAGVLANCLIVDNHATDLIGGLSLENSTHQVFNNTIVNNTQASSTNPDWCGVRLNVGGPLQFCNNIVWGNKANNAEQASQILVVNSYSQQANNFVKNALVWNGKLSNGNNFDVPSTIFLTSDPGFTDAATGDYTLAYPSDLIDSGHGGYFYGTTDLAGNTRKVGTIDRGCYEYTYEAAVPMTYNRTVTAGRYGTICLPYAVATADVSGAQPYKVLSFSDANQTGLVLEEVDAMEAGKPYFFLASADNVSFGYTVQGLPVSAKNENGLYGTIAGEDVNGDEGNYVLQSNELRPVEGDALTLGANRAYVKLAEIPEYTESAPSPRRRVLRIQQQQGEATAMEEISQEPKANSQKLFIDGQLVIIREGVRYNAQGSRLQ